MSDFRITDWRGEELVNDTEKATAKGITSIMSDCVRTAKAKVPKRTTTLQGGIQLRPAIKIAGRIVGLWGVFNVNYAIFVEDGTKPHVILPRFRKALWWPGAAHPVRRVNHPGTRPKPYLRPAADQWYPKLTDRIRSFL